MFKKFLLSLIACTSLLGCSKINTSEKVNLTPEEKVFVEQTTVKVGVGPSFPPFIHVENKKPVGLSLEYLTEISKRTGLKVEIVSYSSFQDALNGFAKKEVDMMTSLPATIERMDTMAFTSPYVSVGSSLLLNELPVHIPLRVGYGRFHAAEDFLKRMSSQVILFKFEHDQRVFFALMNGEVDGAILDNGSARYFENKYNRRFARSYVDFTYDLRFAVQKENKTLLNILEKGVLSFNEKSHAAIRLGQIQPDDVVGDLDD